MTNKVIQFVKKNQPIKITGIPRHCAQWLLWLLTKRERLVFLNSNFAASESTSSIYLIHATADFGGPCTMLAKRLANNLPQHVKSIHVVQFAKRFNGTSIEEYATQLLQLIKHNNHTIVDIIGHSRGGLIATYFAEILSHPNQIQVRNVIAIGTPFDGSKLAIIPALFSKKNSSIAQMKPNSPFLLNLNTRKKNSKTTYSECIAANDSLVKSTPSYRSKVYARHGHLSIMSSHRLVRDIQHLLTISHGNDDREKTIIDLSSDTKMVNPQEQDKIDKISINKLIFSGSLSLITGVGVAITTLALTKIPLPSCLLLSLHGLYLLPVIGQLALLGVMSTILISSLLYFAYSGYSHLTSTRTFFLAQPAEINHRPTSNSSKNNQLHFK